MGKATVQELLGSAQQSIQRCEQRDANCAERVVWLEMMRVRMVTTMKGLGATAGEIRLFELGIAADVAANERLRKENAELMEETLAQERRCIALLLKM